MDDDARRNREAGIFRAAYEQLSAHGYGGASMLRIAKAAKASNETLYRWYGDKDGLFTAMARENAAETRRVLGDASADDGDPWEALARLAPVFLRMITGEKAVLLNRAAAADPSGALGAAISAGGRDEVMPMMSALFRRVCAGAGCAPEAAVDWFLGLVVGDLQIKRVIHARAELSEREIAARSEKALAALQRLIAAQPSSA